MRAVNQYAIYSAPEWATPTAPYVVLPYWVDEQLQQPLPATGWQTLREARLDIARRQEGLMRTEPLDGDDPCLIEVWL